MFITFEGIEGSGKSTQCRLLKEHLEPKGRKVTVTREPGWGAMGKLIRHLILDEKELDIHPLTELYLFCADRPILAPVNRRWQKADPKSTKEPIGFGVL